MKRTCLSLYLLIMSGLLWSLVSYTQDLPILESISFTYRKWTPAQLREVVKRGEGALRSLSRDPSSVNCFMFNDDGIEYLPVCFYEKDSFYMYMDVVVDKNGEPPFTPTKFNKISINAVGQFFTVNGVKVGIGDRLDDFAFLSKWDQCRLPRTDDESDLRRRFNYVFLFTRQGGMLYIGTDWYGGWSNRVIQEMYYVEQIPRDDWHLGFISDHSHVELGYWREMFSKVVGTYDAPRPYVEQVLKYIDDNIDRYFIEEGFPYPNDHYIPARNIEAMARDARTLRQAGIDKWKKQKEAEEAAKKAKWLEEMRLQQEELLKKNPEVIKDIIREEKQRGRVY